MEPVPVVLATLAAYVLGSVPSAYIAGRVARGVDIRTVGSRNVGALNVLHQVGPGAAIAVLLVDVLKGSLAILMAMWIFDSPWALASGGLAVVAGHNWPLFLGFRGGKGAATVLGVSLAVMPWLTILALAPAVLITMLTRNVVFGAALGFIVLNILTVVTGQGWLRILVCLLLTFVVTATYLGRSWQQTVTTVRQGRWLDLLSFE